MNDFLTSVGLVSKEINNLETKKQFLLNTTVLSCYEYFLLLLKKFNIEHSVLLIHERTLILLITEDSKFFHSSQTLTVECERIFRSLKYEDGLYKRHSIQTKNIKKVIEKISSPEKIRVNGFLISISYSANYNSDKAFETVKSCIIHNIDERGEKFRTINWDKIIFDDFFGFLYRNDLFERFFSFYANKYNDEEYFDTMVNEENHCLIVSPAFYKNEKNDTSHINFFKLIL